MKLQNEFKVDAGLDKAWTTLTDLELVASCMPGASLQSRKDGRFIGTVKVKVGPMTAEFTGSTWFVSLDDSAHTAVIKAVGKDQRGQNTAEAVITAAVVPSDTHTAVTVDTELDISGRLATFGRGAIADVSARLMNQFAENLNARLNHDGATTRDGSTGAPASSGQAPPAQVRPAQAASLDLLSLLRPLAGERLPALSAGFAVGLITGLWLLRRRPRRA